MDTFDVTTGSSGATEEETAKRIAEFGFEPGLGLKRWAGAEPCQASKKMILYLGANLLRRLNHS
jgi:hypothetical protein